MNDHSLVALDSSGLGLKLKEALHAVPFELQRTLDLIESWSNACRYEGKPVHTQVVRGQTNGSFFMWPQYTVFILSHRIAPSKETPQPPQGLTEDDAQQLIQAFWSEARGDPALHQSSRDSALSSSARQGLLGLTQFCIEQGADIHYVSAHQMTVFNAAFSNGHLEIAEYLLGQGADIDQPNPFKSTTLLLAVNEGFYQQTRWLLHHGANPNCQDLNGKTALHYAAYNGWLDLVTCLVDAGADLAMTDNVHHTAWQVADDQGHHEVSDYLKAVMLAQHEKETLMDLLTPLPPTIGPLSPLGTEPLLEPSKPHSARKTL